MTYCVNLFFYGMLLNFQHIADIYIPDAHEPVRNAECGSKILKW